MTQQTLQAGIVEAIKKNSLYPKIQSIKLFGSFLHGDTHENSDVDLLVEFEPDSKIDFIVFYTLQEDIAHSLGKKIDLLTPNALSPYLKKDILNEAKTLYEKKH